MATSPTQNPPAAVRVIGWFAAAGIAAPFATSVVAQIFGSLPAANPFGFTAYLICALLWPPIVVAALMQRVARPMSELIKFLAAGAAMNAVTYAVIGALIWYALYRRRWAWLPSVALLVVFWWPVRALLLR